MLRCGAEVLGLDLLRTLSSGDASALRQAALDHQVIVIRGTPLQPDVLVRRGTLFGELTVHPVFPHLEGYPPIAVIQNYGKKYSANEHWHSDVMLVETPASATLLHALDVPEVGGDTQFANQYLAYEGLSNDMKEKIEDLRGINTGAGTARLAGKDASEAPQAVHPIVKIHPETGRKALFACRAFTTGLEGFSTEESKPTREAIFKEG